MKKIVISFIVIAMAITAHAQGNGDVTLVVNGSGNTKDIAINNALRSAIEQAFGVFVSSNTDILNDELIKDEIVSISTGNIKTFKELGCSIYPNGDYAVTLETCVSTSKLTSYAQSKGSTCELAGATIVANMKIQQLYADNSAKALEHLVKEIEIIAPTIFDYNLEITSNQNNQFQALISVCANSNMVGFVNRIKNTLASISKGQTSGEPFIVYSQSPYLALSGNTSVYSTTYFLPCKFSSLSLYDALAKALWNFRIVDNLDNSYYVGVIKDMERYQRESSRSYYYIGCVDNDAERYKFFPHVKIREDLRTTDIFITWGAKSNYRGSVDFKGWALSLMDNGIVLPSLSKKMKKAEVLYTISAPIEIPVEVLSKLTNLEIVVGK